MDATPSAIVTVWGKTMSRFSHRMFALLIAAGAAAACSQSEDAPDAQVDVSASDVETTPEPAATPEVAAEDAAADRAAEIAAHTEAMREDLAVLRENIEPDATLRIDVTAQAASRLARRSQQMAVLVNTPEFTEIADAFEHESISVAVLLPRNYNAMELVLLVGDYLPKAEAFLADWEAAAAS